MNSQYIIQQLEENKNVFKCLLSSVPELQRSWKPAEHRWSLLEIICHLYDEEREDFRARVKHTLATPDQPMPGIDPVGWVQSRAYIEQDFGAKLTDFLDEREVSVEWLQSLNNPDWSRAYQHPKFGPMTASLFLANWLAHDFHHIRQINKTKYEFFEKNCTESLKYAGKW